MDVPRVGRRRIVRISSSRSRVTSSRSAIHITAISTRPPTNSASVKRQPMNSHRTIPSSKTRFVDANWNAIAEARLAPFSNRDFAIAIAAYEHEDDAAPSPVASAASRGPRPPSADCSCLRGTHAWTTPDSANPSTSAHQTSHAMRSAFASPSHSHMGFSLPQTQRTPMRHGANTARSSTLCACRICAAVGDGRPKSTHTLT